MTRERSLAPVGGWVAEITGPDCPLSSRARLVGLVLSTYMNANGGSAFPSLTTLAANCNYSSKGPVIEGLRELERESYIVRTIGGGRGHSTLYEACVPETVAQRDPSSGAGGSTESAGEAAAAALTVSEAEAAATPRPIRETVAHRDPLSQASNGRERVGKGSGNGGPARPDLREGPEVEKAAAPHASAELAERLNGSAAAALSEELTAIGAGSALVALAWTEPERAIAWCRIAKDEARRNPAGFVATGMRSGEWPSARENLATSNSKQRWIDETSWLLDPEDAHLIVDEWENVDHGERAMWHQAVDEARDAHAAATGEERVA